MFTDPRFIRSNTLLQGLLKEEKSKGLSEIQHKTAIISKELEIMNDDYFTK